MKNAEAFACFPTGRHYPGIAHLLQLQVKGLLPEFAADANWFDLPIAMIDVETTGRDPKTCRVIELGIVVGRGSDILARYNWLIHPQCPIPAETTAIHGIRDEDVADKPSFAELLNEIVPALGIGIPAAYNAGFDRAFLQNEFARLDPQLVFERPAILNETEWLDPLIWARELHKSEESRALGEVAKRLGVSLENAHRATDDAEAALRVLLAFGKDERVPKSYAALVQEQQRLARRQEEARRFWRRG